MKSKQIKWLVWLGAGAAILTGMAIIAISVFLPGYLESELIPQMAQKYGLDARQVQIRRLGLFKAELGPIQIDGDSRPVVRIAAIQIDYSPFSLLRGKINRITLGGARLVFMTTPQGLSIPGLKPLRKAQPSSKSGTLPDLATLVPIGLEQIRISQSEVVVLWNQRPLTLSVDMTLACGDLDKGRLTGKADLSFLGSTIALVASLDQKANKATLTIDDALFHLNTLADFIDLPAGMTLSATAAFKGQTRVQLSPFHIDGLSLSGHLTQTHLGSFQASIENLSNPATGPMPIGIAIEAPAPPAIHWQCGPFLIDAPLKTHVLHVTGDWVPEQPGWSVNAEVGLQLPVQTPFAGISLPKATTLNWQVQARQADQVLSADATLNTDQIRLGLPQGDIQTADMSVTAALYLPRQQAQAPSETTVKAILSHIRSKQGPVQVSAPRMDIAVFGRRPPKRPWRYLANMSLTQAAILDSAHGVQLKGISLDMPLQWPPKGRGAAGTVKVQDIKWRHHRLGDLRGRLQQNNRTLEMALRHKSRLFPKLNVLIDGRVNADDSAVNVHLPSYSFSEAVDLGRFFPNAAGLSARGRIEAEASLTLGKEGPNGSASLKIAQGHLENAQRRLDLRGIEMNLSIDDLFNLRSAPQQKLRVDQLALGQIMANDFVMDFQLEDLQTVFIEKARIQWCRGRINTTAFRIAPEKKAYDVTLFCDRLNLAMVLEQLGAGEADGEGTVNGAIPLQWQNGRLSFDKGFLYSTPGQPGVIKLSGTEAVLAGLPPGTPQHTQVDIATEALKDYNYNWAKLSVESQNQNLLLKLQLDGKPNRLLPFAFDKQMGRFKRVQGQGQADFKGIRIDLNFKSPLDEILHYKKLLTPKP